MANIMRRGQEAANVWDPFRIMLEMMGDQGREHLTTGQATFAPTLPEEGRFIETHAACGNPVQFVNL
jgi:hypothetical protein